MTDLHTSVLGFVTALAAPVEALAKPSQRIFGLYLLTAALMAGVVWLRRTKGRTSLFRFLFPRELWLHPSARFDIRLMFARSFLDFLLFAPLVVSSTHIAIATLSLLTRGLGGGPFHQASPAVAIATFTVLSFVTEDAARYLVHRLLHRVPILFELHKVHHSAERLTPFTVYRTHPIEGLLVRSAAMLAIGLAAGVTSWAFRRGASGWEIAGVHALAFVWASFGANLRHSEVWLSYGRFLEHVLISPAQHQIHHSLDPRHHGRNFGSALALWDWLGGTLYVTRGRERLRFGLPAVLRNHELRVASAILGPLAAVVNRIGAGAAEIWRRWHLRRTGS